MTEITLPAPPARVHFIGIGGIGMSGLAAVLHEQGYVVTGSDSGSNAQTEQLAAQGIAIQRGHEEIVNAAAADLSSSPPPSMTIPKSSRQPNGESRSSSAPDFWGCFRNRKSRSPSPVRTENRPRPEC
jgi:hypothetical protein